MWYAGAAEDMAHSSLRFGIGRFTTEAEIDYVIERAIGTVQTLRDMRYVVVIVVVRGCLTGMLSARCGRWCRKGLILVALIGRSIEMYDTLYFCRRRKLHANMFCGVP